MKKKRVKEKHLQHVNSIFYKIQHNPRPFVSNITSTLPDAKALETGERKEKKNVK